MPADDIRHPEKQPNSLKGGRKKYKRQKKETKEGGTEFHPGKGVKKREVFKHQETFSLPNLCQALEAQRAT